MSCDLEPRYVLDRLAHITPEFFIPEHATTGFGPLHFDTHAKLLDCLETMFSCPGGNQQDLGEREMDYSDTVAIDGRTYIWAGPNDWR